MKAWISVIITAAGLLLSVGYNWRRVDEVTRITDDTKRELYAYYVRADVYTAQFSDIQRQLDEIKTLIRREQRPGDTDATSGINGRRMFDR